MIYQHTETNEIKSRQQWQNKLGISFHPDNPPAFLTPYQPPAPQPLTPEQVLARQQSAVRADAETAYRQPVTLTGGTTWNGGFDSAVAINGAAEMAAFAGSATVSIFDHSNAEHVLTIAEAKAVAAQIGAEYQVKFAAKQAAMRGLAAVDLTAADAIDQLSSIAFADFLPTT